jgi:hypothetical protein
VVAFNISVENAASLVNVALKINGVEMQRYSLPNKTIGSIHEAFSGPINLKSGDNTMELQIVDTPVNDASVVRISDVVMWLTMIPNA